MLILGLFPANERRRYFVTASLIGLEAVLHAWGLFRGLMWSKLCGYMNHISQNEADHIHSFCNKSYNADKRAHYLSLLCPHMSLYLRHFYRWSRIGYKSRWRHSNWLTTSHDTVKRRSLGLTSNTPPNTGIGLPIVDIRRSDNRLSFIIGIPTTIRQWLLSEI